MIERLGWIDRSDRIRVEIAGPDRAKFLHNLTTNDVKRLAPGSGQESFVTTPQGKTLTYITLVAGEDSILLRTDPGADGALLPHLRKYGVFDDVAIEDVSGSTFEFHLAGDESGPILAGWGFGLPEDAPLRNRGTDRGGGPFRVIRESPAGSAGWTLIGPSGASAELRSRIEAAGISPIDPATFEAMRIEAGTPASGRDVTAGNLPQEVGRDARAINFVKGCYLGQETVARLDALGHVNRIFRGLRVEGPAVPPAGAALMSEGKAVGAVTSSAYSTALGRPVALGYIKVAHATAGTRLAVEVEGGSAVAEVVDLPMDPGVGG